MDFKDSKNDILLISFEGRGGYSTSQLLLTYTDEDDRNLLISTKAYFMITYICAVHKYS